MNRAIASKSMAQQWRTSGCAVVEISLGLGMAQKRAPLPIAGTAQQWRKPSLARIPPHPLCATSALPSATLGGARWSTSDEASRRTSHARVPTQSFTLLKQTTCTREEPGRELGMVHHDVTPGSAATLRHPAASRCNHETIDRQAQGNRVITVTCSSVDCWSTERILCFLRGLTMISVSKSAAGNIMGRSNQAQRRLRNGSCWRTGWRSMGPPFGLMGGGGEIERRCIIQGPLSFSRPLQKFARYRVTLGTAAP